MRGCARFRRWASSVPRMRGITTSVTSTSICAGFLLRFLQRVQAVFSRNHLVSAGAQKFAGQFAHRFLIFRQQHGSYCRANICRRLVFAGQLRCGGALRQEYFEARALARRAIHPDVSAALLHDAVHGRKAQPCAFAKFLRGEKRFEDSGPGRLVHAGCRCPRR